MPTALVLGGGGVLGAAQVGFIRRIAELAIPIDLVVGTSVGALNAAHVAFHEPRNHDCLEEIWRALAGRPLFHRNFTRIALQLARTRMSLYPDTFVRDLVTEHLASDDFSAARIPLHVTATDLITGERRIFREGSITTALLASTAIPGLFPPVRVDDAVYVDGGVFDPMDIEAAVALGATTVLAIDLSAGMAPRAPSHIVDVLLRSLEVLAERRSACTLEHAQHRADVVHIRPGLMVPRAADFAAADWLIEQSYSMASAVFADCWDGTTLRPGTYQLAVPAGLPARAP